MDQVDHVVQPLTSVSAPNARWRVVQALVDLADPSGHSREWFQWGAQVGDSFNDVVHVLFDDVGRFSDPASVVGAVYFSGEELNRVEALARSLGALIERYPGTDNDGIDSEPEWNEVTWLAASALFEMVRNGATDWPGDTPDLPKFRNPGTSP